MSLSPWDLSGLGQGFGLYRPRRPSYTCATQLKSTRSESYRHATRQENSEIAEEDDDFIDGIIQAKRKGSYVKATRKKEDIEIELDMMETSMDDQVFVDDGPGTKVIRENSHPIIGKGRPNSLKNSHVAFEDKGTPCSSEESSVPSIVLFTSRKNLILLCISFMLIFSSFRAIQNLQSSINSKRNIGLINMSVVYGTMFFTCLVAPIVINRLTAKWALTLSTFCYITWFAAHFYPEFYTLIPTAILAGFGQGILWTAEISYILKLAFDSAKGKKEMLDQEVFRFHGIFLACLQTTHIWGNLISSIILNQSVRSDSSNISETENHELVVSQCGVLAPCFIQLVEYFPEGFPEVSESLVSQSVLWKLMGSYIVLGFIGFFLILFFLDRIGAKADPEFTGYQLLCQHMSMLIQHKTFRLLVPLLIFSGLQQGFIYADFNMSYVTCSLGIEYVGYCMIALGVANVFSAVISAVCARRIPREAVLGFGGVVHIGLMIGYLIWIPNKTSVYIFMILVASWGICDAVWQTQCNTLICLACPENTDIAFGNCRMLQSLGLTMSFLFGNFMCVSTKLYVLMSMLVISIMFYVLAEHKVRQVDTDSTDTSSNT